MKKIFTLVTLLVAMVTGAWGAAGDTYKYVYADPDNENHTTNTNNFFTVAKTSGAISAYGIAHTFNEKIYTQALKMENTTYIEFTATETFSLSMYVFWRSANTFKLQVYNEGTSDYDAATTYTASATSGSYDDTYVYNNLPAGKYKLTRTSEIDIYLLQIRYGTVVETKYTVTTSANNASMGSVTPETTEYTSGTKVTLTATPKLGYYFQKWVINDVDQATNPYIINSLDGNVTGVAHFAALKKLTYTGTTGVAYASDGDGTITVPANHYHYTAGKTVSSWTGDDEVTYNAGDVKTLTTNVALTPNYSNNSVALGDAPTTINWTFARNSGAPVIAVEGNTINYVQQATISGNTIDVNLFIDATSGKCNNTSSDVRAQVNGGTKFTLKAISGMTVTYKSASGTHTDVSKFDFGTYASDVDASMSSNNLVFTYNGSADEITFTDNDGGMWSSGLSVTYPGPSFAITYDDAIANGSISGDATAAVGETVTVTTTPDSGYEFGSLVIKKTSDDSDVTASCSVSDNTFVMPAYAVTVSATFNVAIAREDYIMSFSNTVTPDVYFNITNSDNYSNSIVSASTYGSDGYQASAGYTYAFVSTSPSSSGSGKTSALISKSYYTNISAIEVEASRTSASDEIKIEVSPDADFSVVGNIIMVHASAVFSTSNNRYAKITEDNLSCSGYIRITFKSGGNSKNQAMSYLKVTAASATEPITTALAAGNRNYVSYITSQKLDFASASGISAYIATGLNAGETAVVLQNVDIVPAGTPIIVKTDTKGATVNVPVTTASPSSIDGNKLVAGDGTTTWNGTVGTTYYYLANDQFHEATSGTLQSGKAYLALTSGGARMLDILPGGGGGGTTAIENVKVGLENNVYYDLQGRRVLYPKKGLYIVNGKKVIIK